MKPKKSPAADFGNKAIATRESLKRSAVKLLNAQGYSRLRVEDITEDAGVAKGLFYRYFTNLMDITRVVCEELFESIEAQAPERYRGKSSAYAWLLTYASVPVTKFSDNPGLLACMFELHGSFPEISEAWQVFAHRYNVRMEAVIREAGMPAKEAKDLCFILGAAAEGIIYQALVRGTLDLNKLAGNANTLSETIAKMWYRSIFLEAPGK